MTRYEDYALFCLEECLRRGLPIRLIDKQEEEFIDPYTMPTGYFYKLLKAIEDDRENGTHRFDAYVISTTASDDEAAEGTAAEM